MSMSRRLFNELTAQSIGMGTLPNMRFFEPNQRFLDWFKQTFSVALITPLYDVGAGIGHVSALLKHVGYYPVAIDVCRREGQIFDVKLASGADFLYSYGAVVLLCRPCHSQFVEYTIDQALERKASNIVYVGLEKNFEDDLGKYATEFELVATDVGVEHESIWRLHKIWPPDYHHGSSVMGACKIAEIPKPHRRHFDDKRRTREVKARAHTYQGIGGNHWYVSLSEEDNPVWDSDRYAWVHGGDDPKVRGRDFHEKFSTRSQARDWANKMFKKHFKKGKYKLVWEGGHQFWFGHYREGD